MIAPLSPRAARHIVELVNHYRRLDRIEAARNLAAAIETAQARIPTIIVHRTAPTPYPELTRAGTAWTKIGRYWFAYAIRSPHAIRAIFHETANLPARF